MQPYDAISILVTALVFLVLSAGIVALFKASLRQTSREWARFGVVQIRPGRPFFLLGAICELLTLVAACLCGYGVLQIQLGPQAVRSDNLAVVWGLSAIVLSLLMFGAVVAFCWTVSSLLSDLTRRHATVSQRVSTFSLSIMFVVLFISSSIVGVFGKGWYLLPLGVLDLVCVLWSVAVIRRILRRSPSRQHH